MVVISGGDKYEVRHIGPSVPKSVSAEPVLTDRSPIDRITEILEALFLRERELTAELAMGK